MRCFSVNGHLIFNLMFECNQLFQADLSASASLLGCQVMSLYLDVRLCLLVITACILVGE